MRTRRIREISPHIRVLALSVYRDSVYVREIVRAGAEGCLLKESADTDLLAAVREVAKGNSYLSPQNFGCDSKRLPEACDESLGSA